MKAMGDRFKRYEQVSDISLVRRMPVIGRIDGRAFHTLTRCCQKPYDAEFATAMNAAAKAVCEEIQGAKCAYVQSDEISVLIVDYDHIQQEAWFDYRLQKMCSIAACTATLGFNNIRRPGSVQGIFDARFFNVPANDVCNYFVWRQRDAERNSLQSLAQANFSHKSLQGLSSPQLQEKLFTEKGINYNDLISHQKRGMFIIKSTWGWIHANTTPEFSKDRNRIEELLPETAQILDARAVLAPRIGESAITDWVECDG